MTIYYYNYTKLRARSVDLKSIVMSIFYLNISTTMRHRHHAVQGNNFINKQER